MQRFCTPEGLVRVGDQQYFLARGLPRGAGECGHAACPVGRCRGGGRRVAFGGRWAGSPLSLPEEARGWFASACLVRESEEGKTMREQSKFPSLHVVISELANLTAHLWILTAPCSGTNGLQELPVSGNRLGSGLSLHLYKYLHPLLLTCGLLYSAAKLVNSCNQIAALLTACTKVNNTSIFQCPASSLMTSSPCSRVPFQT